MYKLKYYNSFLRDIKRCIKQNKDMEKFKAINNLLIIGAKLPAKYKDHALIGNWKGYRECHIQPDWLLIYKIDDIEKIIFFARIGSHSELF